jgi:hypothetical protein
MMTTLARIVLALQGSLYLLTGLWPLFHYPSFEAVTGPKVDVWLVHTVGLLLAVIGAVLLAGLRRQPLDRLLVALAIGTALSLALIEVFYVAAGRISAIYLADAVIEFAFAIVLVAALRSVARRHAERAP